MYFVRFAASFLSALFLLLAAGATQAQQLPPPGAYRTAAAYLRRQPQPAGTDAFFPDRRGQLVVVAGQGSRSTRLRVAPDSVWGFTSNKGRTFRIYRGADYLVEHADTLCVYSSISATVNGQQVNAKAGQLYYFSRGLTGLIFPLTTHYLREAYAAGNPAFVAALAKMRFDQSPSDYDRKTGLYRVTALYREAAAGR